LDRKIPEAMKPRKIEIGSGNPPSKPMKSLNAAREKGGHGAILSHARIAPVADSWFHTFAIGLSDSVPALVFIFDSLEKVLDRIVARFVPGPFGLAQVESSDPPE
jgi:hypothetical protein